VVEKHAVAKERVSVAKDRSRGRRGRRREGRHARGRHDLAAA